MRLDALPKETSITAVEGNAPPNPKPSSQRSLEASFSTVQRKPAAMMIVDAQIHSTR
jgi:hypothetical protein